MLNWTLSFLPSSLTSLFIFVSILIAKGSAQTMLVQITNAPSFYYGKICEVTFSIISSYFTINDYSKQTFLVSIVSANSGVRFLNYYQSPKLWNNNSIITTQFAVDSCERGTIGANFTCVLTSTFWSPLVIKYNQTHNMYKFTLDNIICPTQSMGTGTNGSHVQFKVDIPFNTSSTAMRMSGTYSYRFQNLIHSLTQRIIANPVYDSSGLPVPNATSQIQANNFLVGCQSILTFSFDISNITQVNNWETLQIIFLQPFSQFSMDISTCKLTTNAGIMYSFRNFSSIATAGNVQCSYSSFNNILTITNPNYTASNYVINQDYNIYSLWTAPGTRFNISMKVNFTSAANIQFYYKLLATTSVSVVDGVVTNISSTQGVLYESSTTPETLYGLAKAAFDGLNSQVKAYCPTYIPSATDTTTNSSNNTNSSNTTNTATNSSTNNNAGTNTNTSTTNNTNTTNNNTSNNSTTTNSSLSFIEYIVSSIFSNIISSISSFQYFSDFSNYSNLNYTIGNAISFGVILVAVIVFILNLCCRTTLCKFQKYLYLFLILTDPIVKIGIFIVLKMLDGQVSSSKGLSFVLEAFFVIQYCILSIVFFLTYCVYICANKQYISYQHISKKDQISDNLQKGQVHRRNISFMIITMLLNYKFYCVCLFELGGVIESMKPRRFRNDQLYIKYCWHLALESLLILVQIFIVMGSCNYLIVTLIFTGHQVFLLLIIGIVGKVVYKMLELKRMKKIKFKNQGCQDKISRSRIQKNKNSKILDTESKNQSKVFQSNVNKSNVLDSPSLSPTILPPPPSLQQPPPLLLDLPSNIPESDFLPPPPPPPFSLPQFQSALSSDRGFLAKSRN